MSEVKICGVCRPQDATLAGTAGAAYVGVILAPSRARTQSIDDAAAIYAATTARRVGVFVDAPVTEMLRATERLQLHVVQLHGDEPPAVVEEIHSWGIVQVWKAVRVRDARDVTRAAVQYGHAAHALLLDGWSPQVHGGTGVAFDWAAVAAARAALPHTLRVVVAGGLTPDNVANVLSVLQPAVVDVSSGVEAALGVKSAERMRAFTAAVRGAKDHA